MNSKRKWPKDDTIRYLRRILSDLHYDTYMCDHCEWVAHIDDFKVCCENSDTLIGKKCGCVCKHSAEPPEQESENDDDVGDVDRNDKNKKSADENRIPSTGLYVTDVIQHVRAFAPVGSDVRNIIAGYSVNMGDLLAYMPEIWKQDDDEPYAYKERFKYCDSEIYVSGETMRVKLNHGWWNHESELELAGIENLRKIFTSAYLSKVDVTEDDIIKLSRYYEEIATECLDRMLEARD
jgi:hypothetical protein